MTLSTDFLCQHWAIEGQNLLTSLIRNFARILKISISILDYLIVLIFFTNCSQCTVKLNIQKGKRANGGINALSLRIFRFSTPAWIIHGVSLYFHFSVKLFSTCVLSKIHFSFSLNRDLLLRVKVLAMFLNEKHSTARSVRSPDTGTLFQWNKRSYRLAKRLHRATQLPLSYRYKPVWRAQSHWHGRFQFTLLIK